MSERNVNINKRIPDFDESRERGSGTLKKVVRLIFERGAVEIGTAKA